MPVPWRMVRSTVPGRNGSVKAFIFDKDIPLASTLTGFGASRNLGDFNNGGVLVTLHAPCYTPEFARCFAKYARLAEETAAKVLGEMGKAGASWPDITVVPRNAGGRSKGEPDMEDMIPVPSPPPQGTVYTWRSLNAKEDGSSKKFPAPAFATQAASVTVALRRTKNMGECNSAKVIVGGSLPCYREEIEQAIHWLLEQARYSLRHEVRKLNES